MNRVLETPPVEPVDRPQPDPAATAAVNPEGATEVSCSGFGDAIIQHMGK